MGPCATIAYLWSSDIRSTFASLQLVFMHAFFVLWRFVDLPWEVNVKVGRRIRFLCRLVNGVIVRKDGARLEVTSLNLRFKRLDRAEPFLGIDSPFVREIDNATIAFVKDPAAAGDGGPYACLADVEGVKFPGCITTVRVRGKRVKPAARTGTREPVENR